MRWNRRHRQSRADGVSPCRTPAEPGQHRGGFRQWRCGTPSHRGRAGGTAPGPALMAVADVALYVSILAIMGPVALAVTTSLTIHFLRRPAGDTDILGERRLLKVGKWGG
ncbi:MAG: PaaI family thioesterase [Porticoccaceae bacterium]